MTNDSKQIHASTAPTVTPTGRFVLSTLVQSTTPICIDQLSEATGLTLATLKEVLSELIKIGFIEEQIAYD
jgi:DNA-binding transcriptional regulator GbsR (MarR family)